MTKRFLLSLSKVYDNERRNAHEYFPGMDYDPSSVGVWFQSISEAINAREKLKKMQIKAAYNIISYDDPWEEAASIRKEMADSASAEVQTPAEETIDDDELILGDADKDILDILNEISPAPLATGEASITIARLGIGELYFCRDGMRTPLTLQEAEALVTISPLCIHLYAPSKGAEPL